MSLGNDEELSYKNMFGQTVTWKFLGLADLEELSSKRLRDRTEIRTRFFRHKEPNDLVTSKDRLSIYLSNQGNPDQENRILSEGKGFSED
jgi:hypothetical protein